MKLSIIYFVCIAQAWALLPHSYSSYLNKNEIEPIIRQIIEENLDAFYIKLQKTFWNNFSQWMSYNENFIASKFATQQLELLELQTAHDTMLKMLLDIKKKFEEQDQHKRRKHHKRNATHIIEKRENIENPLVLAHLIFLEESKNNFKNFKTFGNIPESKNISETLTNISENATLTNISETPINISENATLTNISETPINISENGAEFVESDYDNFGESIPFFSSTVPPPNYTLKNYFRVPEKSEEDKKLRETIDRFLQ
jgi:hypothetical protein